MEHDFDLDVEVVSNGTSISVEVSSMVCNDLIKNVNIDSNIPGIDASIAGNGHDHFYT